MNISYDLIYFDLMKSFIAITKFYKIVFIVIKVNFELNLQKKQKSHNTTHTGFRADMHNRHR